MLFGLIFVGVVVITALILLFVSQGSKNKNFIVDTATQERAQEQISDLENKLTSDPQNIELKRNLSRAYYLAGDLSDAQQLLQGIITASTTDPQYYVDLGRVYEAQGDYAQAEVAYKKAIAFNTQEIESPLLQNVPPALKESLKNNFAPTIYNFPTPYSALGNLYLVYLNDPNKAISVLLEGIKVVPKYPDFHFMLSEAYRKTGDFVNADKYQKLFETLINPQNQSVQ